MPIIRCLCIVPAAAGAAATAWAALTDPNRTYPHACHDMTTPLFMQIPAHEYALLTACSAGHTGDEGPCWMCHQHHPAKKTGPWLSSALLLSPAERGAPRLSSRTAWCPAKFLPNSPRPRDLQVLGPRLQRGRRLPRVVIMSPRLQRGIAAPAAACRSCRPPTTTAAGPARWRGVG